MALAFCDSLQRGGCSLLFCLCSSPPLLASCLSVCGDAMQRADLPIDTLTSVVWVVWHSMIGGSQRRSQALHDRQQYIMAYWEQLIGSPILASIADACFLSV